MSACHRIRAVAVMYVEIHNRDFVKTMCDLRMPRGDKDMVEQTKPHGDGGLCVMAGRTRGAKRAGRFTRRDIVHGRTGRAGRVYHGLPRSRGNNGICVNLFMAVVGLGLFYMLYIMKRVGEQNLLLGHGAYLATRQGRKRFFLKHFENDPQPIGAFRVRMAGIMVQAGFMGIKRRFHGTFHLGLQPLSCPSDVNFQPILSMASGIHSTIRSLKNRLQLRWVPKWYGAFADPKGGFYERLGKAFQPIPTGQRRLVTQCRQLSIYAHASLKQNNALLHKLKPHFEHIVGRYQDPDTGLWHFSLDDHGAVKDRTCDLYALTFVIFSSSHYYRATRDERATEVAAQVLDLIDTRFRMAQGFAEGLNPDGSFTNAIRRQDPHMHLLEACLFAQEVWGDAIYEKMADELVLLFKTHFFDEKSCALPEDYTDDLKPHPEKGHIFEPGHYGEWVWLLKKHAFMKGEPARHDTLCLQLLAWANRYGWDETHGGIYDGVGPNGEIIEDTKRIWPFCEILKANALMLNAAPDRQAIKDRTRDMVDVFEAQYMDDRGFWVEWLNRDLTPAADYMPGTTPYHVYFGIMETWDVIERRGESVSMFASIEEKLYGWRRSVSKAVKSIKA